MKKIIFMLFVTISVTMVAQEKITEGIIESKMMMSSTNPQMQSQLAMIGDIFSKTYFKDGNTRTETQNMMIGESTSIIDTKNKKMLAFLNNPMAGGKVYSESAYEPTQEDLAKIKVTKGEETKTVLGYVCNAYHAVIQSEAGEVNMTIYATDAISAANKQTINLGSEINGYPMYMEIKMNQMGADMLMVSEVTKVVAENVADAKFDFTAPEGYKKVDKLQGGL